jgi:hypothetical protein
MDYSSAHWLAGLMLLASFLLLVIVFAANRHFRLVRS